VPDRTAVIGDARWLWRGAPSRAVLIGAWCLDVLAITGTTAAPKEAMHDIRTTAERRRLVGLGRQLPRLGRLTITDG
jgi:hypothetical protein